MKTKIDFTKKQKFLAVAAAGLLLLVVMWPVSEQSSGQKENFGSGKESAGTQTAATDGGYPLEAYIERQEQRLSAVLSEIDGVGAISVMITARASRELVVEKDITEASDITEEEDTNGGRRVIKNKTYSEAAVMDDSGSLPYVIKSLEPEIQGVAVAAKGVGTSDVETEIVHTVQALFDVPIHKIKVVKMK